MRSTVSIAPRIPTPDELLDLDDVALREVVDAHSRCAGQDVSLWVPDHQVTTKEARRLCAGCPITGWGGACFEKTVRDEVAWLRKARVQLVHVGSQIQLYSVVGGLKPGVRAQVVKARLLADAA